MANVQLINLPGVNQPLTPKREAFAQAYIETGNASRTHRRAGYGPVYVLRDIPRRLKFRLEPERHSD